MPSKILKKCGNALAEKSCPIVRVESATVRRFAYELSLLEVSGKILVGGMVTYEAIVKEQLLQIPRILSKNSHSNRPG